MSSKFLLGWLQDWSGSLYAPASNNHGDSNRYRHSSPEPSFSRFEWMTPISANAGFSLTPGGANGQYLSDDEHLAVLRARNMPERAEDR